MTTERALSILLVDDHRDGADSLSELLRISGFDTQVVYSSNTALAVADVEMPDVIICDIGMPHMDGCELAMRIASLDHPMPVMIAVTGHPNQRERCMRSGFDHFFLKPADPMAISDLILEHAKYLGVISDHVSSPSR